VRFADGRAACLQAIFRGNFAAASLKPLVASSKLEILERIFRGNFAAASLKLESHVGRIALQPNLPRQFCRGLIEASHRQRPR
jgi:hypothetical protein